MKNIFIVLAIVVLVNLEGTCAIQNCASVGQTNTINMTLPDSCFLDLKNFFPASSADSYTSLTEGSEVSIQGVVCKDQTPLISQANDHVVALCLILTPVKQTPGILLVTLPSANGTMLTHQSLILVVNSPRTPAPQVFDGPQCSNSTLHVRLNDPTDVVLKAWKTGSSTMLTFSSTFDLVSSVEVTRSEVPFLLVVTIHDKSALPVVNNLFVYMIHFTATDTTGSNVTCCITVALLENNPPQAFPQYDLLRVRAEAEGGLEHIIPVELHASDPDHDRLSYYIITFPLLGTLYQPTLEFLEKYISMRGPPRGLESCGNEVKKGDKLLTRETDNYAVVLYRPRLPNASSAFGSDSLRFQVDDGKEKSNIVTIPLNVVRNTPPKCGNQVISVIAGSRTPFQLTAATDDDPGDTLKTTVWIFPVKGQLFTREADTLTDTPWTSVTPTIPRIWEYGSYLALTKYVNTSDTFQYMAQDISGDICKTPGTVTVKIEPRKDGVPQFLDYTAEQNIVNPDVDNPFAFTIRVTLSSQQICMLFAGPEIGSPALGTCFPPTKSGENFNAFTIVVGSLTTKVSAGSPTFAVVLLNVQGMEVVFHRLLFNLTMPLSLGPLATSEPPKLEVSHNTLSVNVGTPQSVMTCIRGGVEGVPVYYVVSVEGTGSCGILGAKVVDSGSATCGNTVLNVGWRLFADTSAEGTSLCIRQVGAQVQTSCAAKGLTTMTVIACRFSGTWSNNVTVKIISNTGTMEPTTPGTTSNPTPEPTQPDGTSGPETQPPSQPAFTPPSTTPSPDAKFTIPPDGTPTSSSSALIFIILLVVMAGVVVLFWKNISTFVTSVLDLNSRGRRPIANDSDDVPLRNVTSVTTHGHNVAPARAAVIANNDDSGWGDVPWDEDTPQGKEEVKAKRLGKGE